MDAVNMAREVGKLIQQDKRYSDYYAAKEKNDGDEDLQKLIGEFNLKRIELNSEVAKDEKNRENIAALDVAVKSIYSDIMKNENMASYNKAKDEMDDLLAQINMVITLSANGEDPETCPSVQPQSACGGDCGGCAGCN